MLTIVLVIISFVAGSVVSYLFLRNNSTIKVKVDKVTTKIEEKVKK